jgi:hypothetical protein
MESKPPQPEASARAGGGGVRVSEWVIGHRPELRLLSAADPDPVLLDDNLVAFVDTPARGRDVALAFERTRTDHAEIGTVVLGAPDGARSSVNDAEEVTRHAGRRMLAGAIVGSVVCAAVIGMISWLLFGGAPAVIGAVVGGAAFGAGVGATWSYVIGTGQSPAYRESFADPSAVEAVAVSVHANGPDCVDAARAAIADLDVIEVHRIDRSGQPLSR